MEEKDVKLVNDFDGTPVIELTDNDAILEKKIMNIHDLEADVKLAIIRRIEDARHNVTVFQDANTGKNYLLDNPNPISVNYYSSKLTTN